MFARRYFGGGGHKNAAGGKSFVSLAETVEHFKRSAAEWLAELGELDYLFHLRAIFFAFSGRTAPPPEVPLRPVGRKNHKKTEKSSRAMQRFASLLHHIYRRQMKESRPRVGHHLSHTQLPNLKNHRVGRESRSNFGVFVPQRRCRDCFFKTKFRPLKYPRFPCRGHS